MKHCFLPILALICGCSAAPDATQTVYSPDSPVRESIPAESFREPRPEVGWSSSKLEADLDRCSPVPVAIASSLKDGKIITWWEQSVPGRKYFCVITVEDRRVVSFFKFDKAE